jgi:MinD superfamily P-loop ATPase
MELVVVSGKGGTGKTSLVGALAALTRNKVLVDCDVDAADLHLILNNKLLSTKEFVGGKRASIDEDICTGCGLCASYCRFDAIKSTSNPQNEMVGKFRVNEFACDGCGVCVRHCPEKAIEFKETVSGQWYISETSYGPLVHARLGLAQANSGKLVSMLRQQALLLANKRAADLIIVDGPPGIGCPVIASTTGADYILVVTEPSMSALHDLQRLLSLTNHFAIPTGICINKCDINWELTNRIEEFAQRQKVKVLGKIPFDHAVTAAQLDGTTIIDRADNGVSKEIDHLWSNLCEEFGARKFSV